MESPESASKPKKEKKSSKKEKSSKKKSSKKEGKRKRDAVEVDEATPIKSAPAIEKKPVVKDEAKQDVAGKKSKVERVQHAPRFFPLNAIANPLATEDMAAKVFSLIEKAVKANKVRRGVKEGTKFLRKGEKGLMVFAGDVEPLDVMSHMPVLCEDHDVPYIFVRSREELGMKAGLKRPTVCILIKPDASYEAEFNKLKASIPAAVPTY